MCGPLHYHFEACDHVLDTGQLDPCPTAKHNNTLCYGDAVSQSSITQVQPGACPYCVHPLAPDGHAEEFDTDHDASDDESDDESEDDLTTRHPSEHGRSRMTSRSATTSGTKATTQSRVESSPQPHHLYPNDTRSQSTRRSRRAHETQSRDGQSRRSGVTSASGESTARLSNIYQPQYAPDQQTSDTRAVPMPLHHAEGTDQHGTFLHDYHDISRRQDTSQHNLTPHSSAFLDDQSSPPPAPYPHDRQQAPQQQLNTPAKPAINRDLDHGMPDTEQAPKVSAHSIEESDVQTKRPERARVRRRRTSQPQEAPKGQSKGWNFAGKLFGRRNKDQHGPGQGEERLRDERDHLEALEHDKDIAKARQRANEAEDKLFQRDTQRAIAASRPSAAQQRQHDARQLREAMLRSINDYTRGLEKQLKHGTDQVRIRYSQCKHEVLVGAKGFAADAGLTPNAVEEAGLCDDCYLRRHRQADVPQIAVEAPSSSDPQTVRKPKDAQASSSSRQTQRPIPFAERYEPSESPTQPAEYARTAPSFTTGLRSRIDPHADPDVPQRMASIAGSRAPSISRVMQNRAREEAHRQRLFAKASEAGSSAGSGSSDETFRPNRAELSAKKFGKQRAT